MAGKYLFAVLALSLLAGCGTPRLQQPLGTAEPEEVRQDLRTQKPLVQWKLTKVTFDKARVCLECGSNLGSYFEHYLDRRFNKEFPALLQKKLSESGIFDAGAARSMSVVARLVKFDPGEGDRRIMTSRQLSIRYEFMDGDSVVGVRDITSVGKSNAFQGMERYPEAVDDAITRNIRLLVLSLIAKSNAAESGQARSEMAALDAEARQDLRGSLGGIVLFGAIDSVKAVGSAVGGAVTFVGQNSGAISAGLNSTAAEMDRSNRSYNAAYAQALTAGRQSSAETSESRSASSGNSSKTQSSTSNPSTAGSASTSRSSASTGTSSRSVASATASSSSAAATESQKRQAAEQAREDALQKKREQEAKDKADRLAVEQNRLKEQVARQQKAEQEKAARLAKKEAEKAEKERAEAAYLVSLAQGVQLVATKCPDGAGHYYATGTRPRIRPELVSCVDVHYQAICPGSRNVVTGVARNFVGMSGCFGDTYQIDPKPACDVKEVRIQVTQAQGCR